MNLLITQIAIVGSRREKINYGAMYFMREAIFMFLSNVQEKIL